LGLSTTSITTIEVHGGSARLCTI